MTTPLAQLEILSQNKNESIRSTAQKALKYTNALKAGAINDAEYKDLMEGLQRTKIIADAADDLQFNQMLAAALQGAVTLGSSLL